MFTNGSLSPRNLRPALGGHGRRQLEAHVRQAAVLALRSSLEQLAQRVVDRSGVFELRRNVGIEHDDIRTLAKALGVLAALALAEVILRAHLVARIGRLTRVLSHSSRALGVWLIGR